MVLSIAETLKERGVDIARRVHFHMVDVDLLCVRAAYIQTAFADISAVVVHGDVLRLTEHASFFTPASIAYPKDVAGAPIINRKHPTPEVIFNAAAYYCGNHQCP